MPDRDRQPQGTWGGVDGKRDRHTITPGATRCPLVFEVDDWCDGSRSPLGEIGNDENSEEPLVVGRCVLQVDGASTRRIELTDLWSPVLSGEIVVLGGRRPGCLDDARRLAFTTVDLPRGVGSWPYQSSNDDRNTGAEQYRERDVEEERSLADHAERSGEAFQQGRRSRMIELPSHQLTQLLPGATDEFVKCLVLSRIGAREHDFQVFALE